MITYTECDVANDFVVYHCWLPTDKITIGATVQIKEYEGDWRIMNYLGDTKTEDEINNMDYYHNPIFHLL